jgi:hypothetical protein
VNWFGLHLYWGRGNNLESILLISPVADLYLCFRMQECRPPRSPDPTPVLHCLDFCRFIVNLEIMKFLKILLLLYTFSGLVWLSRVYWLTLVIPAMWKVDIGRITVQGQHKELARFHISKKQAGHGGQCM